MKIEDFFRDIQQNKITNDLIIFKNPKSNDFIASQYITEILKQHDLNKEIISDLADVKLAESVFDSFTKPALQVYKIDKFDCTNIELLKAKNLVISCNTITTAALKIFKDFIIEVPELTDWQIKDFLYSQLDGLSIENIESLMSLCNNDIYRVQTEIDRLKIFPSSARNLFFNKFKEDFIYDDLTTITVFDFINGILTRNINKIITTYKELYKIETSPFGILTLLYNNFRNIISIQLRPGATPENTGINANQFYIISRYTGYYTKDQLQKIFLLITDIDRKIKIGEFEPDNLLDYLLVNIFAI